MTNTMQLFFVLVTSSYDHLVITLTYIKNTTNLDVITTTLMSYLQNRKNLMEETQDEAMYVKGRRNHGWYKQKVCFWKKTSKFKNKNNNIML